MSVTVTLDESDRQAVLLALALMMLLRPGWAYLASDIAKKFGGVEMMLGFVALNKNEVRPQRSAGG